MDALIRFIVLATCLVCVIGGHPGYFGYQQQPPTGYFPTFYQPLPPPQPIIRYHAPAPVPASLPQHFYSAAPANNYRGFAYHTEYQDGGRSQVVFVTGPESQQLMEQSLAAFRQITPPGLAKVAKAAPIKPSPVPITKTVPGIVYKPTTQPIITPVVNSQTIVRASQPIYNRLPIFHPQPIFHAAPAISPVASVYNVQVFPTPGHPAPFVRVPFPHHPFISSFYSQQPAQLNATGITVEASTETEVTSTEGETATEGNVNGAEGTTEEAKESVVTADENVGEAEENVGEADDSVRNAEENVQAGEISGAAEENVDAEEAADKADSENAEENVGEENGGEPQESTVNEADPGVSSLFLRLSAEATDTATDAVPTASQTETSSSENISSTAASTSEGSSQATEAMEVTTPMPSTSEETNNEDNETSTQETRDQTTVTN